MELLVEAGITPDAIPAATRNGAPARRGFARRWRREGADLVVLGHDPLADIRNTLAIERVMSRVSGSPDSLRRIW
jgi:hypothetical protein